jgi:hypothetical protein
VKGVTRQDCGRNDGGLCSSDGVRFLLEILCNREMASGIQRTINILYLVRWNHYSITV